MALILKSNKVATNAAADWKYMSPYGATHKEVADYLGAIMVGGFDPGQSVFNALDTFVTELKTAGIWSKVPEIMPLYGGGYASICRKLKGEWGGLSMSAVNGDGIGNYELINGVYIGRNEISYTANNGPALNTAFQAGHMNSSWGFTAMVKTQMTNTTATSRELMGAMLDIPANNRQIGARFSFASGHPTVSTNAANFASINASAAQRAHISGLVRFSANKTGATASSFTYRDESGEIGTYSGNYDEAVTRAQDIWILGRNNFGGQLNGPGFNGKMRFAAFDDGTLGSTEAALLINSIKTLATAMGKGF